MERSNEGDDTDTSRDEEHWNHDDAKPSIGKGGDKTEYAVSDLASNEIVDLRAYARVSH